MDYFRFLQALSLIEKKATARTRSESPSRHAGTDAHRADAADTPERWHEQALEKQRQSDAAAALDAWEQALRCDVSELDLLDRIGQGLRAAGHDPVEVAARVWGQAEFNSPTGRQQSGSRPHPPGWQPACLDVLRQNWSGALPVVGALFRERVISLRRARNLAFLLRRLDRPGEADCVLASNLLKRGWVREAADAFLAAPSAVAQSPEFLDKLLHALRRVGKEQLAMDIASNAAARGECTPMAYMHWALILVDLHRCEDAIDVLQQGADTLNNWFLRLQANLILPAVPASQADMDRAHQRVHRALHALPDLPLPTDASELAALEEALEPNFFLAYRGEPDIPEIRSFGRFVKQIMDARFPQHAEPCTPRRRESGERIRIGYATNSACQSAPMRFLTGWLEHADRASFELHLFPLASPRDRMSGYLDSLVDHSHEATPDTETAARAIQDANLDILVYPEIGLHALCIRLAALRLAPVQCVANGHSVSTGLPTLDYFISNDAMEPTAASSHYTERLVTLPGIGLCLPPSPVPTSRQSRHQLGLPPEAIVYCAMQSLFKYLPRHDDVFARIAKQVDQAVFLFREDQEHPVRTRTFHERLQASFEAYGLDPEHHVRIVPSLPSFEGFLDMFASSDVFLDPIGWSGALTALDALSCDLPPVLLPGKLMRGRQSYGFLKQLGIEDTIATDIDDYVRIATQLGLDTEWRADVSRRIRERRHLLFNDTSCVRSLEAFYRWAVGAARPGDEALFKLWPPNPDDPV